jgi:hypothetical protein
MIFVKIIAKIVLLRKASEIIARLKTLKEFFWLMAVILFNPL